MDVDGGLTGGVFSFVVFGRQGIIYDLQTLLKRIQIIRKDETNLSSDLNILPELRGRHQHAWPLQV